VRNVLPRTPQNNFNVDDDAIKTVLPNDCPPDLLSVVIDCCQFQPERRPSFRDVVARLRSLLTAQETPPSPSGSPMHRSLPYPSPRKEDSLSPASTESRRRSSPRSRLSDVGEKEKRRKDKNGKEPASPELPQKTGNSMDHIKDAKHHKLKAKVLEGRRLGRDAGFEK